MSWYAEKQVAANFHQLYPYFQSQLPNSWHFPMFSRYLHSCHCRWVWFFGGIQKSWSGWTRFLNAHWFLVEGFTFQYITPMFGPIPKDDLWQSLSNLHIARCQNHGDLGTIGSWKNQHTQCTTLFMWILCMYIYANIFISIYMGVSKNRGTPKWMVFNAKPYQNGWFGGTTIFGNTHI